MHSSVKYLSKVKYSLSLIYLANIKLGRFNNSFLEIRNILIPSHIYKFNKFKLYGYIRWPKV